ncbi:universal stress protein [Oceanicoccus sp. KOV_DT_Chl]|uniref:universal stress protein n=1 Tax=Oceanicoccus sp. KOV_DT_Chl TaxID=1904639 RepID=UPI000C7BC7B4|nr:universal stress protein [Oceanicoccus sp. KOV_DT_Chl]
MYRHILVAIDLLDTDIAVLKKACEIAKTYNADVSVIHVCDAHVTGYGEATAKHHIANDMQIKQQCFPLIKSMLQQVDSEHVKTELLFGRPADVIHQFAEQKDCDLIVVGSHGYSGVKALLGSTAHKVLHGAQCDVHTVRII